MYEIEEVIAINSYDSYIPRAPMTSIFEGHFQAKQGSFGFQV